MKSIILPIIVLFLVVSCTHTEKYSESKKTIITGQVSNFAEVSEHDFIEFIFIDLLAVEIKFTEYIDKNGQFRFEPEIDHPTDFYLKYSGLQTYYISPGDSIHFDIDGNCWGKISETYTEEYEYYKVSGTSEKMNIDVANYTAFFLDSLNDWTLQDSMIRICTPNEYKNFLYDLATERLEIISGFNRKNNTCKQFQDWISLKLKYEEWDDLMRYRWLHPMRNKKDRNEFIASMPDDYYSFLDDWDNENKEYLKSKSYLSFLREYAMFYNQKLSKDAFSHLDRNAPNAMVENFKIRKAHILSHEPGFIQDVLLAKMIFCKPLLRIILKR